MSMEGNIFLIKSKFVLLLLILAFADILKYYERNIDLDRQSNMSLFIWAAPRTGRIWTRKSQAYQLSLIITICVA